MNLGNYIGLTYEQVTCWGLVRLVYQEQLGIELPELEPDTEPEDVDDWYQVTPGYERPMDVAVFREPEGGKHVGLVVGSGKMLHSTERQNRGSVIERYKGFLWRNKLLGFYRHAALV